MFTPAEVAKNAVAIGKNKASMKAYKLFLLGILAGMFIAFASLGANTAACKIANPSAARLLSAAVFPAGLAMVLVAGSELFTGNSLMVISLLEKEITLGKMLRNWGIVYLGNLVGSVLIALIAAAGGQFNLFGGALAATTASVAVGKATLSFGRALLLGVLCNVLVCVAVYMSFAAKTVGGKIAAVFFPVMLFVLSGLEHSVANMYYLAAGLFAKAMYPEAVAEVANLSSLTVGSCILNNLIPVTIGNVIGGGGLVGAVAWAVYLKQPKAK